MTPTENASEASEKRALWRIERHARRGEFGGSETRQRPAKYFPPRLRTLFPSNNDKQR